jgi:hypothetical protein
MLAARSICRAWRQSGLVALDGQAISTREEPSAPRSGEVCVRRARARRGAALMRPNQIDASGVPEAGGWWMSQDAAYIMGIGLN